MLTIYNESKTPWTLNDVNDRCVKLSTSRTISGKNNEEDTTRTIGLHISGKPTFEDVDINTLVEMTKPCVVSRAISNVLFQQKDCKPFVTTEHKYSKDVMFISINLHGSIITNITTKDVFILNNFIAKGELGLIAAISDKNSTDLVISLHNVKDKKNTTYTFSKVENEYTVDIKVENTTEVIDKPTYKITKFRPAKPTYLIFTHKNDVNALNGIKNVLANNHMIVTITSKEELDTAIKNAINDGYSAATLFVNTDDVHGDGFNIYRNNFNTIKEKFSTFNVLLNSGKTLKR